MGNINSFSLIILATTFLSTAALAADLEAPHVTRAVSGPNGKIELGGGWTGINTQPNGMDFYGAGSFSVPLGDTFGLQADIADVNMFNQNKIGAAAHFFTRNPESYLVGAYGGVANYGTGTAAYIGPEAELYLGRVSLEATGGFFNISPNGLPAAGKAFIIGDLGLYATDDLRFTVGASSIADFKSAHVGAEWLLEDTGLPISLKTNAQFGDNNFYSLTAGLSIYFGSENKSLIRRHREDDPRNRTLDIFQSGLGATAAATVCRDLENNIIACK